jgi:DNA gyrase/topoisomerase IV subunit A
MKTIEIIKSVNKFNNSTDLIKNIDLIIEILKNDILKFSQLKKVYFADFDFTFSQATIILKKQITKIHLTGIRKFLEENDIEKSIKWLFSRIFNLMINLITNKKLKFYCAPILTKFDENIKSYDFEKMYLELELEKLDRDTIKNGLQTIYKNLMFEDLDYSDIEYLSIKFGIEISEIVGTETINLQKYDKEQVENGYIQLIFIL